ncbi:unnamed protein product [Penicillium salamii]|nr:unnamed protein product [Penicillium salamii]CAG8287674.1 unnamed protein product [Penicillium salamii]CAG8399176.1 unnamed protein product [Penicillium salamii]
MTLLMLVLLALLCYSFFSFRLLYSLRKVPTAHWSSRFSSARILWARWTGTELKSLIEAHNRLGPIVLVGPQDLSVSSYQDGIRKVYDTGFPKPAPFYSMFNYYRSYLPRARNAFTSLDRAEHGIHRRRTATLYSKSALMQSKHLCEVTDCIIYERLFPRLESLLVNCGTGRLDGLDLSYRICVDYLSSFLFGCCNSTNFLSFLSDGKAELKNDPLELWRFNYENMSCQESFFVQEMPGLYKLFRALGTNLLPRRYSEGTKYLENWMSAMADKADHTITLKPSKGLDLEAKDDPVVYETAKEAVKKDSPHLSLEAQKMQVQSEMFDHICLVFGYALWYLASQPDAQQKIHAELEEHKIDMTSPIHQDPSGIDRSSRLDSLPYLHAVIDECLRMRPTSTLLPRTTPPDRSVSVAGIDIPPNTRINSFQWFVHRDPKKWDNVNDWDPERWFSVDRSGKKHDREDVLWPFASGPRMCLGNHLTYYFMKHVLAAICSRFVLSALPRDERQCTPGSPEDELPITLIVRT